MASMHHTIVLLWLMHNVIHEVNNLLRVLIKAEKYRYLTLEFNKINCSYKPELPAYHVIQCKKKKKLAPKSF